MRAGKQVGGKKIEQREERKPETGSTNSVNHLPSPTETTLGHQFRASSCFTAPTSLRHIILITSVVRNFFCPKGAHWCVRKRGKLANAQLRVRLVGSRQDGFALFRLLAHERLVYL